MMDNDLETTLALQDNPVVVAQLLAWNLVRRVPGTLEPESHAQCQQAAEAMRRIMSCILPVTVGVEYVIGEEEDEHQA